MEGLSAARVVLVLDHLRDFGNHVAAALHLHPVADLHAQALDFIHVVQGGVADRRAADRDRRQFRYRRELAGAAHLHADAFDLRDAGARRVFVGDGPARSLAGEAELSLQTGAIDLDDDAIDFVGQTSRACPPICEMKFQTSSILFARACGAD